MTGGSRTTGRNERGRALVAVLAVTCVLLIALDLALALRVRGLLARVESLTRVVEARGRPTLVEGAPFPRVTLRGPDGEPSPLTVEGVHAGALVLLSSLSCDACDAVRPHWRLAAETAEGSHLRVLELVLDAEPEDLRRDAPPWPRAAPGDDVWSLVSGIPGVPAAVLVDDSRTVWRAFYGTDHAGLPAAVEEFLLR